MSALAVRNLDKSFGGLRVTSSVTLLVEPGERRLIIGPNGAGKTTLFNLITGELAPDRGSVELFDRDITRVPSRRRFHLGMARTYQIITLFPNETLLRNVTLALLGLSRLRWNPFGRLDRQTALLDRARATLAQVGLEGLADRPLRETRTASAGAWRSPWPWPSSRGCCCSTSPSPVCRWRSGATCCAGRPGSRAT